MDSVTHWLAVERHPQLLLIEASIQTTALKIGLCFLIKFSQSHACPHTQQIHFQEKSLHAQKNFYKGLK